MRYQYVKVSSSHPDYDIVCFPDTDTYEGYIQAFKAVGDKISITNISKKAIIEVISEGVVGINKLKIYNG